MRMMHAALVLVESLRIFVSWLCIVFGLGHALNYSRRAYKQKMLPTCVEILFSVIFPHMYNGEKDKCGLCMLALFVFDRILLCIVYSFRLSWGDAIIGHDANVSYRVMEILLPIILWISISILVIRPEKLMKSSQSFCGDIRDLRTLGYHPSRQLQQQARYSGNRHLSCLILSHIFLSVIESIVLHISYVKYWDFNGLSQLVTDHFGGWLHLCMCSQWDRKIFVLGAPMAFAWKTISTWLESTFEICLFEVSLQAVVVISLLLSVGLVAVHSLLLHTEYLLSRAAPWFYVTALATHVFLLRMFFYSSFSRSTYLCLMCVCFIRVHQGLQSQSLQLLRDHFDTLETVMRSKTGKCMKAFDDVITDTQ